MCALLLSGCATPPPVEPHIPDRLLQPCLLDADKPIITQSDSVNAYADAVTAVACANRRIAAIADIYHGAGK